MKHENKRKWVCVVWGWVGECWLSLECCAYFLCFSFFFSYIFTVVVNISVQVSENCVLVVGNAKVGKGWVEACNIYFYDLEVTIKVVYYFETQISGPVDKNCQTYVTWCICVVSVIIIIYCSIHFELNFKAKTILTLQTFVL